jgi:hypothetical protein
VLQTARRQPGDLESSRWAEVSVAVPPRRDSSVRPRIADVRANSSSAEEDELKTGGAQGTALLRKSISF